MKPFNFGLVVATVMSMLKSIFGSNRYYL